MIYCVLGLWNVRSFKGKFIQLAKILHSLTTQETKWAGAKALEIDGFKLWYSGCSRVGNGVSIIVVKELVDLLLRLTVRVTGSYQ